MSARRVQDAGQVVHVQPLRLIVITPNTTEVSLDRRRGVWQLPSKLTYVGSNPIARSSRLWRLFYCINPMLNLSITSKFVMRADPKAC
jgi:hypothetical protein